jgi:hypothetical protein
LRKIPTGLHGPNLLTSSARYAPSSVRQPNGPKSTQIVRTHQNVSLVSYKVDQVCSLRKILMQLRGTHLCTSAARFAPSFVSQPNGLKCTQIVWNAPKRQVSSYKVDRVHSLPKIPTRLCGTNFCTRSSRFAPSSVRQPNGTKSTQIVRNAPTRQFSVL